MFLHSGASLHGHEYSKRQTTAAHQHGNRRSPLLRSALATQKPRASTPVEDSPRPQAVRTSRPRPLSEHIPRFPEPLVRFVEIEPEEPHTPSMIEDPGVQSGSELSDASQATDATAGTSSRRRRRRVPRTITSYFLACPAPRFGGKRRVVQKVAPKLYLQLQQLSAGARPKPVIDVFPSSRIAGPLIAPRLAKRFPRIFGVKGELGSDDVVLMRSEDYDTAHGGLDSEDEDNGLEQRKLLAVFSPVKKSDFTEIVLDDGSIWVASQGVNGNVDFVHTDLHGNTTTARWVNKSLSRTGTASPPAVTSNGMGFLRELPEQRYTFSIINPLSRRHPIMATLTQSQLDIQDHYTTVTTSAGRYPPSRPLGRTLSMNSPPARSPVFDDESDASAIVTPEPESGRTTHPVDEATKMLISVSAIWVALRSGWSPYYKPPTPQHVDPVAVFSSSAPGTPVCTNSTSSHQSRRSTWNRSNGSEGNGQPATQPLDFTEISPPQRPASVTGQFNLRKGTTVPLWGAGDRSRDPSPAPSLLSGTPPPPNSSMFRPMPRRATSTGAAFMQRHIQMHSEASDSERSIAGSVLGSGSSRRKGRRILSGDWATGLSSSSRRAAADHTQSPFGRIRSIDVGHEPTPIGSPLPVSPISPLLGPDRQKHSVTAPTAPVGYTADAASAVSKGARHARSLSASPWSPPARMDSSVLVSDDDGAALELANFGRRFNVQPSERGHTLRGIGGGDNIAAEDDTRRGITARLKSFSNWIRRVGAH